ncbi:hypothetical protein GHK92_02710 [Nocardioides sp. dk4132]|nr:MULTISPECIES: hypothetical protein [unclassified Nocardioides]MQW74774.1 hypothetical protein [Nocardioides sp. dk4132]
MGAAVGRPARQQRVVLGARCKVQNNALVYEPARVEDGDGLREAAR